jgi:hypothetical protein
VLGNGGECCASLSDCASSPAVAASVPDAARSKARRRASIPMVKELQVMATNPE